MPSSRRSEKSHELTPEERSRGGITRAQRIRTAKLDAMAEGRPYKPTRKRRRRAPYGFSRDPYDTPEWRARLAAAQERETAAEAPPHDSGCPWQDCP